MAIGPETFKRILLQKLAEATRARFVAATKSRTLREAWQIQFDSKAAKDSRVIVFVPHYWAWPYFLGRGPVTPVNAKKLVWFVDPQEDPRLQPQPPKRITQRKRLRLPKRRFRELLQQGKIVIRDRAGSAAPQREFLGAVSRLPSQLVPVIRAEVLAFIQQLPVVQPTTGRSVRVLL